MFCKQCGSELKESALFCTNCGASQSSVTAVPVQDDDPERTVIFFEDAPEEQPVEPQPIQPVEEQPVQQQTVEQSSAVPAYQYTQVQNQVPVAQPNVNVPTAGEAHHGQVGFVEAIALFFKNYVNFSGRASKSEYWWVFLFNMLANVLIGLLSSLLPPLGGACSIALMIPGISLAVRRLHDTGKSGAYWFMGLIPIAGGIILLIQFLKDSEGDNQWGPGPKGVAPVAPQDFTAPTPVTTAPVVPAQEQYVSDTVVDDKPQQRECSVCGYINKSDAKFCPNCGTSVPTDTPSPSADEWNIKW